MTSTIRFAVNGTIHTINCDDVLSSRPYLKLSEYLREDLCLTGTKVACGEGGCGGCTVLITRGAPSNTGRGRLSTTSANACLVPLTTLNNCAVTTVEGIHDNASTGADDVAATIDDQVMYTTLTVPSGNYEPRTLANAGPDAALGVISPSKGRRRPHPIQRRFASYNASQCGFCTPGFVMAVCGFLCKQEPSDAFKASSQLQVADIEDALDGNLCRCTGYRPILEAAAGTSITECPGNRQPDANCAQCVGCPRASQCLPTGAHEQVLEEARSVLKLVSDSFPFALEESAATETCDDSASCVQRLPAAPQSLAARASTIAAAIYGGTADELLSTIEVVSASASCLRKDMPAPFGPYVFPTNIEELVAALTAVSSPVQATLTASQTSAGIYKDHLPAQILNAASDSTATVISLLGVAELAQVTYYSDGTCQQGLTFGANTTISELIGHLLYQALKYEVAGDHADVSLTLLRAAQAIKAIAGTHIRDVGTVGGNLSMCRNMGFASDLATPLCALGASVNVLFVNHANGTSLSRIESLRTYLAGISSDHHSAVMLSVSIPLITAATATTNHMRTHGFFNRVAARKANAYALLNAACLITVAEKTSTITEVTAFVGNAGLMDVPHANPPKEVPRELTRELLVGRPLTQETINHFKAEFHVPPHFVEGTFKQAARIQLVKAFLVASLEACLGVAVAAPPTTRGFSQMFHKCQDHELNGSAFTEPPMVGRPLAKQDGILHATGTTTYITDMAPPSGTLFMSIVFSSVPSGIIDRIGVEALLPLQALSSHDDSNFNFDVVGKRSGDAVVAWAEEPTTALVLPAEIAGRKQFPFFIGASDLPSWALNRHPDIGGHLGEQDKNAYPGGYLDFPLVANKMVAYYDQPIGVVVGRTLKEAELGAKAVTAATTYKPIPSDVPIPDRLPRVPSILGGRYEGLPHASICKHSITDIPPDGTQDEPPQPIRELDFETVLLGQKHFYMENQACVVIPADGATRMKVHLAVHGVQHAAEFIAKSGGYAMNQVEVLQHRMGGSFGGKTNVVHACLATIVSRMFHRPVVVALDRVTDMRFQGGREEMQIRSKVAVVTASVSHNKFNDDEAYHALRQATLTTRAPRIVSVETTTHADIGARIGFSNYTLGYVMPFSIMRCYSPTQSVHNTTLGYLTQSCERTNVRSPGHAEAGIITESIIDRVAAAYDVHSQLVREMNFLSPAVAAAAPYSKCMYTFPGLYKKMMAEGAKGGGHVDGWAARINKTIDFNQTQASKRFKKGAAVVPFEYPLGAGQFGAMVVVLPDGSVVVHHSGVEMGQGLVAKTLQAANQELSTVLNALGKGCAGKPLSSLPMSLFQSAGNSSHTLPKHGITGGSTSSEGSVDAVIAAARKIADMLEPFVCMLFGSEVDLPEAESVDNGPSTIQSDLFGEYTTLSATTGGAPSSSAHLKSLRAQLRRGEFESHTLWSRLIALANSMGANLTATAMNDSSAGTSYSIYCVGGAEVTVDTYTGVVELDRVDIIFDGGRSLNPAVDIGQIEGAFMMGLGYVMTEENADHDLITGAEVSGGSTWKYKIPSVRELPSQFNVQLISPGELDKWLSKEQDTDKKDSVEMIEPNGVAPISNRSPALVLGSKATGEPPLCIVPCVLSAIRQAVQSTRADKCLGGYPSISVPFTPEKILNACGPVQ